MSQLPTLNTQIHMRHAHRKQSPRQVKRLLKATQFLAETKPVSLPFFPLPHCQLEVFCDEGFPHTRALVTAQLIMPSARSSWVSIHLGSLASSLRFQNYLWVRRDLTVYLDLPSHSTDKITEVPSDDSTCSGQTVTNESTWHQGPSLLPLNPFVSVNKPQNPPGLAFDFFPPSIFHCAACHSPQLSSASLPSPHSILLDLVLPWFPPKFSNLIWCWLWHSVISLDPLL